MTFGEAVQTCFRKYVTFSGRATRPEYWWFFLFLLLGSTAASIIDAAVFGAVSVETDVTDDAAGVSAPRLAFVG